MRVSLASVEDLSLAEHPMHIYFSVKFVHPCHYAVFGDNSGLDSQLNQAVVNGKTDSTTMGGFPYTFPTLPSSGYECGLQTASIIDKPSFISISPYDEKNDKFELTVESTSVNDIGTHTL